MKLCLALCAIFLGAFSQIVCAEENPPTLLELHWQGKSLDQSESAQKQILEEITNLVRSSNFHSGPGSRYDNLFTLAGVQKEYRKAVAGRFLAVNFPTPQKIETVGGEITVAEIVVALNRDDMASGLYTIDETGRVVGHAKYAGIICISLFKIVKQFTHDIQAPAAD